VKVDGKYMISHSCTRQTAAATDVADTGYPEQATVNIAVRRSDSIKGFSLIEAIAVCLIILIVTSIAVVALGPMRDSAQINTAVQLTINQLRMAHEEAMAKRLQYVVTLQQPGTILTQWTKAGIGLQTERTVPLPNGIQFSNEPGIPNGTRTPDGFGTAVFAIDFDLAKGGGSNVIYFQPDGTAIDAAGNPNNGVVYIAKPGQTPSCRAITLFGATGRLKSWSLTGQGANLKWQ
jgi:type II secretory pathway pseudopilin PulG